MSDILVIPIFAGGLFFLPIFLIVSRDSSPRLRRQLRLIFVVAMVVLGALAVAAKLTGRHFTSGIGLFPAVNFLAVAFSSALCIRDNKSFQQRLLKPRVAAVAAMTFVVTVIIFFGGLQNLDVALHEARTTATVTGRGSHGVLLYQYQVDGKVYEGAGDPGNPPYSIGTNYEIRYSSAHPYFSSAQNPFILFGQMLVAMAFVGIGAYSIRYSISKKNNSARNASS